MASKRLKKTSTPAKEDTLRIRVTGAQRAAFESASQRLGLGLSAFARLSMLEKARAIGIDV